ncbi:MAG: elongation factor G, partial [Parcubacteria group bacterium]|nr:elongation factor G [Parcubacteria group bacterium]
PMGEEERFQGVVDLLMMKAVRYEGDFGQTIAYSDIPAEFQEMAKTWREKLLEKIVAEDETLMEAYLAGKSIEEADAKRVLRKACLAGNLIPVFCGSALKNKGVQSVLDGVIDYLPSPVDLPPVEGVDPKTGTPVERHPLDTDPFSALAFKIASDPYVGTLTYFRVYSGTLKRGSYVLNSTKNDQERIGRIVRMHANQREEVEEVFAGDIAGLVGMKNTFTGDTLCDPEKPILLEKPTFPEPVISMKIEPKTKADQERMGIALRKLQEEDPTFRVKTDQETLETIIAGMGELHLEILVDRMLREFKVEAAVGRPQVAYKETIKRQAEAEGKYIRQTGGRGQYGHVWLRVEPLERGKGYEFVNAIRGGIIPQEFIPAVEKGVREALEKGVLAGYPVVDAKVTLYDGSYHEVDSSEVAFKIAGSMAFQEAAKRAELVMLEPIMKVEVITPDKFLGDVSGDLNSKRGRIEHMSERGNLKVIDAKVPLAEMFGYATKLRSMTEGRASFTMEFDRYEEVPRNVAEAIIAGKK